MKTSKTIKANELKAGDVILLPFGKIGTVTEVHPGTQYMNIVTKEYGKTRTYLYEEVLVAGPDDGMDMEVPAAKSHPTVKTEKVAVTDGERIWLDSSITKVIKSGGTVQLDELGSKFRYLRLNSAGVKNLIGIDWLDGRWNGEQTCATITSSQTYTVMLLDSRDPMWEKKRGFVVLVSGGAGPGKAPNTTPTFVFLAERKMDGSWRMGKCWRQTLKWVARVSSHDYKEMG